MQGRWERCSTASPSDLISKCSGISFPLLGTLHLATNRRQRGSFQDLRHGVADLAHHHSGAAGLNVDAFVALPKLGLTGAGQRRERPLNLADHRSQSDLLRRLSQLVSTMPPFLAFHKAECSLRRKAQDLLQKFLGDRFLFRKASDQGRVFRHRVPFRARAYSARRLYCVRFDNCRMNSMSGCLVSQWNRRRAEACWSSSTAHSCRQIPVPAMPISFANTRRWRGAHCPFLGSPTLHVPSSR